jgi:hypothetical protein
MIALRMVRLRFPQWHEIIGEQWSEIRHHLLRSGFSRLTAIEALSPARDDLLAVFLFFHRDSLIFSVDVDIAGLVLGRLEHEKHRKEEVYHESPAPPIAWRHIR